jgi:hypothetical protein
MNEAVQTVAFTRGKCNMSKISSVVGTFLELAEDTTLTVVANLFESLNYNHTDRECFQFG